jgi:carbonic anhydrase
MSAHDTHPTPSADPDYNRLFERNRAWVAERTASDPEFFTRRAGGQSPTFLFIGCSDSRVSAELLTGVQPGEMFVHRNVANVAAHSDLNLLAVLQYAVDALKVRSILVCGHYGCGGVRASMGEGGDGLVDHWLRGVRDVIARHEEELAAIADDEARYRRVVELNAAEQAANLCRNPVVRAAWARGQALSIHAMVYGLADGILRDLGVSHDGRGARG